MSGNPKTNQVPHAGEAVIGRAFRRSLLGLLLLALIVALAMLFSRTEQPADRPVEQAPAKIAATEQRAPADTPPPLVFTDISGQAGIDFVHVSGAYGERLMPETIGSGAAFLDYDNDGDPDLFLVNSRYWEGHEGERRPRLALYRNDGRGNFTDVTEAAGLALGPYGMGVAVGDYDNDGWADLYVSAVGRNYLFHNVHGRFEDVTEAAGVAGQERDWSTGSAFFDYDNDGDLDLFVGNYVRWSRDIDLEIDFRLTGLGRAYGAPNHFVGTFCMLFRNDGDGRFSDVSEAAGIRVTEPASGAPASKALGVVPLDYDGDGRMDLFVANDTVSNFLFRNLGDGRFEEVGAFEGLAYDREGKATSAMGVDAAWFRNDRDLGLVVGNFANEMSSLYVSADGKPPFADEAVLEGLGPASRQALTFAVLFFDADLDGRLDLLQVNGHLEQEINKVQPSQFYEQPAQLFWNCAECRDRFRLVQEAGAINTPMVGRGAGYADIDGDGDLDLVITQSGRRAVLLRNDQAQGHHWLRVRLQGTAANRDGIGAVLELTAGGATQRRLAMPSRGYLSQMELPVTFGLGSAEKVDGLRVIWPGGQVQEVPVEGVDTTLLVRQIRPQ
jgi:hypothetical protein